MNKEALKYYGVTKEEYAAWCKAWGYKSSEEETKRRFFNELDKNHIYRGEDGKIKWLVPEDFLCDGVLGGN